MRHDTDDVSSRIALFRYGLIADLIHLRDDDTAAGQHTGLCQKLREKADKEYEIPGSHRRRVAAETMRSWLRCYRNDGFNALRPKPRSDAGTTRKIPEGVADRLVEIKEAHPDYSVPMVIAEARRVGENRPPPVGSEVALPPSTVHRLLSRAGLMEKKPEDPTSKDRRKFSFEHAGELWMSDVMHGPSVTTDDGRRKQKAYLIATIDDATRIIPFAACVTPSAVLTKHASAYWPGARSRITSLVPCGPIRFGPPSRVPNWYAVSSSFMAAARNCSTVAPSFSRMRPTSCTSLPKFFSWIVVGPAGTLPFVWKPYSTALTTSV